MLLLKLIIVPSLLAAISLAAKRWGPQVGGFLAGFPIVTGPILLFVSLQQGHAFAAESAIASLSAVVACIAFGLGYSWVSLSKPWPVALLAALVGWLTVALVFASVSPSVPIALCITIVAIMLGLRALPTATSVTQAAQPLPKSELAARMVAGAALVLAITAAAPSLGTRWTGLLAMFPVLGTVLGVFSHRSNGSVFVSRLFRGMFSGFYSFAAFCAVLSFFLVPYGRLLAFPAAISAALLVQVFVHHATAPNNSFKPNPFHRFVQLCRGRGSIG